MSDEVTAVIVTREYVGWFKNLINRMRGLPTNTCHVEWVLKDPEKLYQGFAVCLRCGRFHGLKPQLSDLSINQTLKGSNGFHGG